MDSIKNYWWVILIVLACIYQLFKPRIKGFLGEKTIRMLLGTLPKNKYMVLNDILLEKDTRTAQIDHIVVSVFGIYVIETKNYKGWIFGKETDEFWIQNIYGQKNRFKNPIRQNYGHIQMLKAFLPEDTHFPIHSIIAFSSRCDLKVTCDKTPVLYFLQVRKYILKTGQTPIATIEEARNVAEHIQKVQITDKKKRKQHVHAIQETVYDIQKKEKQGICPKCGAKLVQRKGKYGEFTGCSSYPKCKYIVKE